MISSLPYTLFIELTQPLYDFSLLLHFVLEYCGAKNYHDFSLIHPQSGKFQNYSSKTKNITIHKVQILLARILYMIIKKLNIYNLNLLFPFLIYSTYNFLLPHPKSFTMCTPLYIDTTFLLLFVA